MGGVSIMHSKRYIVHRKPISSPGDPVPIRTYIDNDGLPTIEYKELPDVKPGGYYSDEVPITDNWKDDRFLFIRAMELSEDYYKSLIVKGWKPQEARAVLPNVLKTELVMTGFINDWKHFFELRCAPNAHPSARELAIPLSEEFVKRTLL